MSRKPLVIDGYCGLGGWSDGFLAEGWECIGIDIERHNYGTGGYPGALVLQDMLTVDGGRFKDADCLVFSPPCTEFSYMAMPWKRAKQIAAALRGKDDFPENYKGSRTVVELTALFDTCFRIQREAIDAAGRHIPMVVENVRGAQKWVGRARWMHGSFALWGDVPALMPITLGRTVMKDGVTHRPNGETNFHGNERSVKVLGFAGFDGAVGFNVQAVRNMKAEDEAVKVGGSRGDDWFTHHNRPEFEDRAMKNSGGSWFGVAHNTESGTGQNPDGRQVRRMSEAHRSKSPAKGYGEVTEDGVKQGGDWFNAEALDAGGEQSISRRSGSKSSARKAASARIAMIPLPLARWIARAYFPREPIEASA